MARFLILLLAFICFFFFQAEDGIRDLTVTGVQTCALPISQNASGNWVKVVQRLPVRVRLLPQAGEPPLRAGMTATVTIEIGRQRSLSGRSEERRVGEEGRSRGSPYH